MPTGIELIRADHEHVNELFEQFDDTDDATIVGQIVGALTAHDEAEHAALYPLALRILTDGDTIARFDEAHSNIKSMIEQLSQLEGAPLVETVNALRQAVVEHVADEEADLLTQLEHDATTDQLNELAAHIEHVKQRAG